jgi:diguanylate cyclase (GGDEF)-like protein
VVPIETDDHVLRARRTAACTRAILGLTGIALAITQPNLLAHPALVVAGFATITFSATVQLTAPGLSWLKAEESLAGAAAVLIVGLGDQQVTILSVLWLAAVASGVMARGGRVHWIGRTVVLTALALPVIRQGHLSADQAALAVAAVGLLLTSGRLTRELNHLLRRARWDADHDDLTGLLSRAAFRAVLEEATGNASDSAPISLLLLDLDGFGMVNKSVGHAAGDALLASFGERLRGVLGPHSPAGRLGGDEFALIVPDADALPLAERLLEEIPRDGEEFRGVSASVGVAQAPRDGSDAEALLRAGDIALRVAKRSGTGGQISTYVGQSLSGHGEQSARGALTRLIEGDGLSMAVQPIVDLRTGSVHAYEALARLGPAGTGSPLQWFSLADEFGERDALERACLRAALQLFSERPAGMRLSVNLSAPVLLDRRTLHMLDQPASLAGLIIEVTEEALVQSDAQLRAAMAPLRARGARLAVDDVGAGYSGLRQLTTVHPSYMKLDRSLVSGIDHDGERAALVSALVGYAERVGSLLVAEGIENEAELLTLRKLGAPLAQGFYLGRPGAPWPAACGGQPAEPELPAATPAARPPASTLGPLQPALG